MHDNEPVFKIRLIFFLDDLIQKMIFLIVNINKSRGDLTNISATFG